MAKEILHGQKKSRRIKKQKALIEIHLENDGRVIFSPLTPATLMLFKRISAGQAHNLSVYCG
jgi:hypothetical protein